MAYSTWATHSFERKGQDSVTVRLKPTDSFNNKPGQFINIMLMIGGECITRSYSLSSVPELNEIPEVTIKRIQGGIFSNYVVDNIENIEQWNIEGPMGNFYLSDNIAKTGPIVLIAAGSGITPVMSMLKYSLHYSDNEVVLLYGSRTLQDILYYKEIEALREKYNMRLHVYYFLSQDMTATNGIDIINGRITKLLFKKLVKEVLKEKMTAAHYFLCGPEEMIGNIQSAIESLGIKNESIHREYFYKSPEPDDNLVLPDSTLEVLLHHNDQTNLIEVLPGETILDSALKDKIALRYSCKSGTCGMCIAKKLEGELAMRRNYALTKEQVEEGYVLLCQSHPLNDTVTIESFSW